MRMLILTCILLGGCTMESSMAGEPKEGIVEEKYIEEEVTYTYMAGQLIPSNFENHIIVSSGKKFIISQVDWNNIKVGDSVIVYYTGQLHVERAKVK